MAGDQSDPCDRSQDQLDALQLSGLLLGGDDLLQDALGGVEGGPFVSPGGLEVRHSSVLLLQVNGFYAFLPDLHPSSHAFFWRTVQQF